MSLGAVDERTAQLLGRFGFDAEEFDELRAQVASGALSAASNVVSGVVGPPAPEDVVPLPEPGSDAWREARDAGLEALAAGRVAQVVLAGGMATRFGGVVKGVVEALDGGSFLGWKLGETARLGADLGVRIPVALMTSFATDEVCADHDGIEPRPEVVDVRDRHLLDAASAECGERPGRADRLEQVAVPRCVGRRPTRLLEDLPLAGEAE